MRWWTTRARPSPALQALGGFSSGDVVRHKVTHALAVLISFRDDSTGPVAVASLSFDWRDEFECYLAEIERCPAPTPGATLNADSALDPVAVRGTEGDTREKAAVS